MVDAREFWEKAAHCDACWPRHAYPALDGRSGGSGRGMAPTIGTTAAHRRRREGLDQVTSPDRTGISPAARRVVDGALFDQDGDHHWADDHFPCGGDPAGDVVMLPGVEYMRCDHREVRRAVQIRDIEAWIESDRVDFAFGPSALGVNAAAGWVQVPAPIDFLDPSFPGGRAGDPVFSSASR